MAPGRLRVVMPVSFGIIAVALAMITGASRARADSVLTLGVGSDPAESITTQLTATGTAPSTSDYLYLTIKPAGGRACAANWSADDGTTVSNGRSTGGSTYSFSSNHEFDVAGTYLLCGWIEDSSQSNAVVDAQSLTITVRPPHLALSITAPTTVTEGQTFQVTTTAQAEASRVVYAFSLPSTGDGCPANAAAASSAPGEAQFVGGSPIVGGPTTLSSNQRFSEPGTYLFCAYFEYPNVSSPPEAAASATTTVLPPCTVPKVKPRTTVSAATRLLTAAHCTAGPTSRTASVSVPRGRVIRLASKAGTVLAPNAAVGIVISTGPPCIVPRLLVDTPVKAAAAQLVAHHCTAGPVTTVASGSVPRGDVIAFKPHSGARLPTRQAVAMVVSSGHRTHHRKR